VLGRRLIVKIWLPRAYVTLDHLIPQTANSGVQIPFVAYVWKRDSHKRIVLARACVREQIWSTLQVQYVVGVRPWSFTGRLSSVGSSNYYQGYVDE